MSACKADTSIERKKGDGPPGLNRLLRTDTIHLAALWELGLAAHIQGSLFCCFVLFCFASFPFLFIEYFELCKALQIFKH